MTDTIVPVTNGVNGDITDCKIETAKIKVERKGALSFTQRETYRSYDVCTKKTINEYQTSAVAGGLFLVIFLVFIGGLLLAAITGIIVSAFDS